MHLVQNIFQAKTGHAILCGNAIQKMVTEMNEDGGHPWSAAQGFLGQPFGWFAISTHVESLQEFVDLQAASSADRSRLLSVVAMNEHLMAPLQLVAHEVIYAPAERPDDWAVGSAVSTAIDAARMPEVIDWATAGVDIAFKVTGVASRVVLNPRAEGAPRLAFLTLLPSLTAYETRQATLNTSDEFRAHVASGQALAIPMTGQSGIVQRLI